MAPETLPHTTATVVVAIVQFVVMNDPEHSLMDTSGAPGGVTSTTAVRVDVALVSVEVAAEKETVVVPEESKKLSAQFPPLSVVVVANMEPYAAETTEEADVVPVKVTLVVAKSLFSSGESIERESVDDEGVSVVCVGLLPPEPGNTDDSTPEGYFGDRSNCRDNHTHCNGPQYAFPAR